MDKLGVGAEFVKNIPLPFPTVNVWSIFQGQHIGAVLIQLQKKAAMLIEQRITAQHGLIYDKLIREFGVERARLYLEANQKALEEYCALCRKKPPCLLSRGKWVATMILSAEIIPPLVTALPGPSSRTLVLSGGQPKSVGGILRPLQKYRL